MRIAVDLRSLMETQGRISGVENYLLNNLWHLPIDDQWLGFYNSYRRVRLPDLPEELSIHKTRIPNKILNAGLTFLNMPTFEHLYGDFDVLWMPDLRPFALGPKTKLAINVHDLSPIMHPELFSVKRRLWHQIVRYHKALQRADVIFTISEYTKYDLTKIFGIPENKVQVIYPGINHEVFQTHVDQRIQHKVRSQYKLPERYILSLSTIEPRKNISTLLRAFEQVQAPDVYLVIAGRPGWLYKDLFSQIRSSPKNAKIIVTGYVEEGDKPYLLSMAEIVCYPSFYEGFGFVPLEAMACGVPVITSARTAMAEACGNAALLVEPYQLTDLVVALQSFLDDQHLREHFIQKGLAHVQQYSWQRSASQIFNTLQQL